MIILIGGALFASPDLWPMEYRQIMEVVRLIFLMLYLCLWITVCSLFVHKLVRVYRETQSDDKFTMIITKIVILHIITLSFTLTMTITLYLWEFYVVMEYINHFMVTLDYFANLICIVLCYQHYDIYYKHCCGRIDNRCHLCWTKLIAVKEPKLSDSKDFQRVITPSSTQMSENDTASFP